MKQENDYKSVLKELSLDQRAHLTTEMQEWLIYCSPFEEAEVNSMSDEELIRSVEGEYIGGLAQFVKDALQENSTPSPLPETETGVSTTPGNERQEGEGLK